MRDNFKFKSLTALVFCLYQFWGFFGLDITMSGGAERLPVHRIFIFLTALIAVFNIRQVWQGLLKNKLIAILVFYVLCTAIWSYSPAETAKNFIFLISSLMISVMCALAFKEDYIKLLRYLFWLCFFMVIFSVFVAMKYPQYGINTRDFGRPRWIGITDHPNALGGLVLMAIWSSTNLFFLSASKVEKIISIVSVLISGYAVFMADSMTSIMASIGMIGYATYLYLFGRKSVSFKITVAFIGFFGLLVVTTFYMSTQEIVTETLAAKGRDTSLTGRSLLWQHGIQEFWNQPLLGMGFDTLEGLTKKYHVVMAHLHNGYIEVLVKGGVVAGILFLLVLVRVVLRHFKLQKSNHNLYVFLSTGLAGILIHNFAETSFLKGLNGLGLLLFFIIAFTNVSNNLSRPNLTTANQRYFLNTPSRKLGAVTANNTKT